MEEGNVKGNDNQEYQRKLEERRRLIAQKSLAKDQKKEEQEKENVMRKARIARFDQGNNNSNNNNEEQETETLKGALGKQEIEDAPAIQDNNQKSNDDNAVAVVQGIDLDLQTAIKMSLGTLSPLPINKDMMFEIMKWAIIAAARATKDSNEKDWNYARVKEAAKTLMSTSSLFRIVTQKKCFQNVLIDVATQCAEKNAENDENMKNQPLWQKACLQGMDIIIVHQIAKDKNFISTQGSKALTLAVMGGSERTVALLAKNGVNLNAVVDEVQLTPLMVASAQGNINGIQSLLRAGADTNAQDKDGQTALMHAVRKSKLEVVHILLDAGADMEIVNGKGQTALSIAVYPTVCVDIMKALIHKGADVNAQDGKGNSILMLTSILWKARVTLLLKAGADIGLTNNDGNTALMGVVHQAWKYPDQKSTARFLRLLICEGKNGRKLLKGPVGGRALLYAVSRDWKEGIEILLAAGADINFRTSKGKKTVFDVAENQEMKDWLRTKGATE